ncbi:hypothetical protein HMPREF1431_01261 [Helicobacter pylori GAMchJs106B]|nr:hypothetical protein HPHPP25C_0236 [Helicobacter pylori Hp P-25c]EJC38692.1 hypothetical protein HPHPP25D_0372 [Helicobacter pylori Hp P-25d]EMH42262.1 hypothetical protein HMPREF1431_01261 [Helicobacter pylori GAMchJs106B]
MSYWLGLSLLKTTAFLKFLSFQLFLRLMISSFVTQKSLKHNDG